MPSASIRNVTWIFGTPRGAGGIPVSSKRARLRLSAAILRSPCSTWTGTNDWLSTLVVKISLFSVGIVVLRGMRTVKTPPPVSTPIDSGVTSSSSTSTLSSLSAAPWRAAPAATTSSGFTPLCGSFPKNCFTVFCTAGIRVIPPTRITLWMSVGVSLASASAFWQGSMRAFDEVAGEQLELGAGHRA